MTKREQLPKFMQVYEQIREPRAKATQREQIHSQLFIALDGEERDARDASFRAMLAMMEAGEEIDDEMLAATWADHLQQFDYDPVEAVNDWWVNWGRYMNEQESEA
jgi:salicylate hydroxylase